MFRGVKLTICSLALLFGAVSAHAATISPSLIDLSGERGEVISSTFSVLNTGASEQTYYLDVMAFKAGDETGSPQFFETQEESGLTQWIKFSSEVVIIPAQSKGDVPFEIVLPDDIESGGYYAAVTVSTAPTDIVQTNGVIIEAKTAVLVLLTVEGDTKSHLELLDFTVERTSKSLPFGSYTYRIQNQGNVHGQPMGEIRLKNIFGQVVAVADANEAEGHVLPSSTRSFSVPFNVDNVSFLETASYQLSHLLLGPVIAELDIDYGNGKK